MSRLCPPPLLPAPIFVGRGVGPSSNKWDEDEDEDKEKDENEEDKDEEL